MTTFFCVESLSKNFGGLQALKNVSFDLPRGAILGLMGANGAGKTTLFGLVAGHLKPSGGRILLEGRLLNGLSPDRVCRAGISRTFQIVRPFAGLSVDENVAVSALYGAGKHTNARAAQIAAGEAIEAVGLGAQRKLAAGDLTLSGQKRLEIARALATGARIVMLDEVMAGLTPPEVDSMIDTLARLRAERDLSFVIIEHVMGALMKLSDQILVLDHGETIAYGTPAEIASSDRVSEVYFG